MRLPRWLRRDPQERPIAEPLAFEGVGVYEKALPGADCGVVLEDDGSTGYLYVTNAAFDHLFDALHVYDCGSAEQLKAGEAVVLVWSQPLQKVGLFYHEAFQAVVSFQDRRACGRSGFPASAPSEWGGGSHAWAERLASGLA